MPGRCDLGRRGPSGHYVGVNAVPSFRYRALTSTGDLVSGSISAPTAAEVSRRIEYLELVLVETIEEDGAGSAKRLSFQLLNRPRSEDVTGFTRDLALLLKSGARINEGLELLAQDIDLGRLRPTVATIRAAVLAGDSFAEAVTRHPALFPPVYEALVRVGEASGKLDYVLQILGDERARAEALRRRLGEAVRYPIFVFLAASCVLTFFLLFVLPQFATVLRDFNARLDPVLATFLAVSEFLLGHTTDLAVALALLLTGGWLLLRRAEVRSKLTHHACRLPLVRPILTYYRTALFCRNLSVLLVSGVPLTTALQILADLMNRTAGNTPIWRAAVDRVRHGGKLSDALAETSVLPGMAIRMLRIGEETGQLPMLSGRIAEFYEAKLQRALDRIVGIAGPLAIITISIVVGGLIVSVMTALLSVSQMVE